MNQKGFIPIIFAIVGAVVIVSAAFGVVKYRDELSRVPVAIVDFLTGSDEEPIEKAEPIQPDSSKSEDFGKKTEKAIEKEEEKEEKGTKRIVKGPRTGPKKETLPEEVEEIEEQEIEVIEADVLTISNINIDINKIPTDPIVVTWITNKESNTSLEYGLSSGSYDWLLSNNVSKETDAGFLHAIYLYIEFNRVHHFRVSSVDSDGNIAESENMTFRKTYYPFRVPCHPPKLPIITSHTNNQTIGVGDDEDGVMPGVQIELKGIASADGYIFTNTNSVWYETPVGANGRWEQEDITLEEGKNILYIKVRNVLNCESNIILTFYVDSEAPTATIEKTNHVGNDFTIEWSSPDYPDCTFDIKYKVKLTGGKWETIEEAWQTGTTLTSRDFIGAESGTYKFNVKATDLFGNAGDWLAEDIEVENPA